MTGARGRAGACADDGALRGRFDREGRLWFRGALSSGELVHLCRLLTDGNGPGARVSAGSPLFRAVAAAAVSRRIAALWPGMRPVRLVAFEKTADLNWGVPWHQDRVIAVDRRAEAAGCTAWSRKAGVWHCEPPESVLDRMLFVRMHLDPSTARNGAMEIVPGSHRLGAIAAEQVAERATGLPTELTLARAGDVLVLPMLTFHRSLPSQSGEGRRVLRVDYAAGNPPPPLLWAA